MSNRKKETEELNRSSFKRRLRRRWRITASVIIVLWTIWTLLNAFVIPRDIVSVSEVSDSANIGSDEPGLTEGLEEDLPEIAEEDMAVPDTDEETADEEPESELTESVTEAVVTDTSYYDGETSIEITTQRILDTTVYIAEVKVNDSSRLRTALAGDAFGRNITDTTSSIAEQNDAIFAVNGDYYGFRDSGYVMRSGYLYRDIPADDPEQEDLVIYKDGSIEILCEGLFMAEEIVEAGAREILSFGPGLIIDGEISVSGDDEVERAQVTNPRAAFGVLGPLHYLFVVSDGRTEESVGLSLYELAKFMKDQGCVLAYNLDGGGSATMWFNGQLLNKPTTFGDTIAERSVSDIVYISK